MKIIETEEEFRKIITEETPMPASIMSTSGYGNLAFECGCGQTHRVNDPYIQKIASYRPVKILFKCSTHYTKVRIKGIFSQTCISEWTCKNSIPADIVNKNNL